MAFRMSKGASTFRRKVVVSLCNVPATFQIKPNLTLRGRYEQNHLKLNQKLKFSHVTDQTVSNYTKNNVHVTIEIKRLKSKLESNIPGHVRDQHVSKHLG